MNGDDAMPSAGNDEEQQAIQIQTRRKLIRPRGANQTAYLKHILDHDLAFGIGPAGTGKTYLAVACAVDALENEEVRRIVLEQGASHPLAPLACYALLMVVSGNLPLGGSCYGPERALLLPAGWSGEFAAADPAKPLILLLALPR